MADQVGGNRLHCSTCKDDRIFRPNSNHKHWGRTVARENFTECIGERCDRCRRWRELKGKLTAVNHAVAQLSLSCRSAVAQI